MLPQSDDYELFAPPTPQPLYNYEVVPHSELPTPLQPQYSEPSHKHPRHSWLRTLVDCMIHSCVLIRDSAVTHTSEDIDCLVEDEPIDCHVVNSVSPASVIEQRASPVAKKTPPPAPPTLGTSDLPHASSSCFRLPYTNPTAIKHTSDLVHAVHVAYVRMVKTGVFLCSDFTVGIETQKFCGVSTPDFDMMGVMTCAITVMRRVLPEDLLVDRLPYQAQVVAAACLLVAYKLRSEGSIRSSYRGQVAKALVSYIAGTEVASSMPLARLTSHLEKVEAWLFVHFNLFALIDNNLYWHFEFELHRHYADGRVNIEELLSCVAAGFFFYEAAAANPTTDVLEHIATRATSVQIGHALALITLHALVLTKRGTTCVPDNFAPGVDWVAWNLVVNAAEQQLAVRTPAYSPNYQKSSQALACLMTSRVTLCKLIMKLECLV